MQGNVGTLVKNLKAAAPGLVAYFSEAGTNFATWKKIKDRQYNLGPESVRDQAEVYEHSYWKRHLCQDANMWVDKELSTAVSRKEVANLMSYKMDSWKLLYASLPAFFLGGWSLPLYVAYLGNDTHAPSQFNTTAEERKQWRHAQDLLRYKYAPAYLTDIRFFFDFYCAPTNARHERAWEEMWEKNDVRRDPAIARDSAEMYDRAFKFYEIRRNTALNLGRAMGVPTFPMLSKICMGTRIRDYWELAWNEDYMVITGKLHEQMSDEELYDYAWRRYLAPYDKELTREQLLQRVGDYHTFLGKAFVEEGVAPNIFMTTVYCMGYYNEPAYLVEDIAELEKNDYTHLAGMSKDAFMRRLEFENGPLRDEVEAHSQKLLADRKAAAEAAAAKVAA